MHYISLINGMSNAQADDLMSFATDLLDGSSGIVASTDYAVAQSSPVAMSVTVGTGKAYIYISSLASYYRTILDAAATLSIAANSSGSTRIDTICIKIDTGATPDANASNVATVVVVQGTPGAGAPATPANHYKLAEVTVANGAVSIVTANIADSRVQLNIRTGTKVGGVTPGAATDAAITFTDVTTNNASTSKHGFLKKLSNVATEFMNGVGDWVSLIKAIGSDITTGTDDAKYLTAKALADAGVNTRLKSKMVTITRDGTAANGAVAYTGVGFVPTSMEVMFMVEGSVYYGNGFSDNAKNVGCIYQYGANTFSVSDVFVQYSNKTTWAQSCVVTTYDADGFTLTWTKAGSPTAGTISAKIICYR